jgi:hypothetical protein
LVAEKLRFRDIGGFVWKATTGAVIDRKKLLEENLDWATAIARNVHRKAAPSFELDDLR